MAYTYEPLSGDHFKTRLLRIASAQYPEDPIRIQLHRVCLASKPEYQALSYTWGRPAYHLPDEWDDDQSSKSIDVNGKAFQIRYNLFSALQAIRHTWLSETLWWIDAICINQDNIPERSRQVANMGKIYTGSIMTVVWLGPPDEMTPMAFEKMTSLSKLCAQRAESWSMVDEDVMTYASAFQLQHKPEVMLKPWRALLSLLCRPWFQRTWVAQEICLSSAAAVQCGDHITRWSDVYSTHKLVAHLLESPKAFISDSTPISTPLVKAFLPYFYMRVRLSRNLNVMLHGTLSSRSETERPRLLRVLERLRGSHASDQRDKVFASFGLASLEEQLPVDYSLPAETLYTRITQKSIQVTGSFQILAYCYFSSRIVDIPSWVIDWSDTSRSESFVLPQKGLQFHSSQEEHNEAQIYHASGSSRPWVHFDGDSRRMVVKAALLGQVAFMSTHNLHFAGRSSQAQPDRPDLQEINSYAIQRRRNKEEVEGIVSCSTWLREWLVHQSHLPPTSFPAIDRTGWPDRNIINQETFTQVIYKPKNEPLLSAFRRTLIADVMSNSKEYGHQKASAAEMSDEVYLRDLLLRTMIARLDGRAFAVSDVGHLALVPSESCLEDWIVIVQGSELPFVLRPTTGGGFLFIGQAYVHGVMDGEVWEDVESGKVALEEISII